MPRVSCRGLFSLSICFLFAVGSAATMLAQQTPYFSPGNLVVSVEGCGVNAGTCTSVPNGTGNGEGNSSAGGYGDNQAAPLALFQYAPNGATSAVFVNSLVFPQTASGFNLPVSGEYGSLSEGSLQLSGSGQYLAIMGYGVNANTFNANPSAYSAVQNATLAQSGSLTGQSFTPIPRVATTIDAYGNVSSSTASYNVFNGGHPRSTYSVDGINFYISGQGTSGDSTGGVFLTTLGAANLTPVPITGSNAGPNVSQDTRTVNGYDSGSGNQLYVSTDSNTGQTNRDYIGTLGSVGALPTSVDNSGSDPAMLAGYGDSGGDGLTILTAAQSNGANAAGDYVNLSPENYFFASPTVLYVADSGSPRNSSASSQNPNSLCGAGGLQKWVLVGSAWTWEYTLYQGLNLVQNVSCSSNTSGTTGLFGLTASVSGDAVTLYATSYTVGDLDPSYLFGITDSLSATTSPNTSFTQLATAPPDSNFKGVSFAPTLPSGSATITSSPSGFAFSTSGTGCVPGAYVTPVTLIWTPGNSCVLSVATPQIASGTQYNFNQWQDGTTAATDVVTAPETSATYTLSFSAPSSATPAPAVVSLSNLTQTYSGSAEAATVSTMPAGLAVSTIYSGAATIYGPTAIAPTNPGSYSVLATVIDPNYVGQQSGLLTIIQVDPTLNLTLMPGMPASTAYGTTVYFSLAMASAPQCPTGTAQLFVDGITSGSPTVLDGTSCAQPLQFQTAALSAGVHSIYAAYSGDAFFAQENSGTLDYTVTANTTTVTLGVSSTSVNVGQQLTFVATINPASPDSAQPPVGNVTLYDGTIQIGTGATLSTTAPYTSSFSTSSLTAGPHSISATFVDIDGNFVGNSSPLAVETVSLIVPMINWAPSSTEVSYGTPLATTQLNAAAADSNGNPVSGSFSYNFSAGTVLNAGTVNLTATFTPSDPTTFAMNSTMVTLTVDPAPLTVTPDSLSIVYGANPPALTYQIAGFVNSDSSTAVSGAASCSTAATNTSYTGSYPIYCALGTLAASNYIFQFVSGTLTVTQATTTVTSWPTASAIVYGQALGSSVLTGGSASVAGTFAFVAPATVPSAGIAAASVTFTPGDTTNHSVLTGSINVIVNKAMPTVALTGAPASAVYGSTFTVSAITNATTSASITGSATAANAASTAVCQIGGDSVFVGVGTDDSIGTTWPSTLICTGLGIPFSKVTNHALSGAGINYIASRLINLGVYTSSTVTTWDCCENNTLNQGAAYQTAGQYEALAAAAHAATPDPAYDSSPTPAKQYAVSITPAGSGCTTSASTHFAAIARTVTGGICTFTFTNVSGPNAFVIVEADTGSSINPAITIDGAGYTGAWSSGSFVQAQGETDGIAYAPFALPISLGTSANGSGNHTVTVTMTAGTLLELISAGQSTNSAGPSVYISGQYHWYDYNNPTVVAANNQALAGAAVAANQAGLNVVFNDPETLIDGYASTTITWGAGCSINPDTVVALANGSLSSITLNPAGQKAVCTSAPSCKINGVGSGATCSTTYAGGTVTGIAVGSGGSGYLPQQFNTQSSHPNGSGASAIATSMLSATIASGPCSVSGTTVTITGSSGTCSLTASWAADANYTAASATQAIVPMKAVSTINWPTPAPIAAGTALSATQLNATATSNGVALAGTFSYLPPIGTMLSTGQQALSVSFSPTYGMAYASVSATVPLTVNQALPKITWAKPAAITYGTALSSTQLNATASVPGTFAYAPAAGAVLNAGTQTLSVTFTPTDTTDYAAITSTMTITVSKVTPVVTWTVPAPAPFGTALSSTQLNATASVPGTFVYTPALGSVLTPGTQTLSVAFTPTDSTDYNAGKASAVLQITQATPIITWPAPAAITYGTALSATQLRATAASNGTAVTGTFTYTPATGTILKAGTQTLSVSLAPYYTIDYATATASVPITVNPATPKITWATPAAISYGTALSSTQLNATASVPGTFVYTPAAGTVMTAGTQTLSVTFNPNDSTDYMPVTSTVPITVGNVTPVVSWTAPPSVTYGSALSSMQLDATASVPGTFAYTPAAGTLPVVGTQTLSVTFNPSDTTDYAPVTKNVTITVAKATPAVTWTAPASVTYGNGLGSTQLNATSTVPGAFVYTPASGTVLAPGTQTLSVTFTPTDATDYNTVKASAALQVTLSTPTITWSAPTAITYGTALSPSQLNATATVNGATVNGAFTYTPAAGTALTVGTQPLSVTFTPSNSTDYNSATASVPLTVNQATTKIIWANPAAISYGTALSNTQLNATGSVPGTFVYTPALGTILSMGTQALSVTFTPTDSADYAVSTGTATISVGKASPPVSWPAPAAISYGTALSSAQLNATASVPGTFAYTPAAGTILTAGTQTLSVTFIPTDSIDYAPGTSTVLITIGKGSPAVNWMTPAPFSYGTALSSAQLSATASVPGTFAYTPGVGTVLAAGTQTLSVTFTPTDATDYTPATSTALITVGKGLPAVNWNAPGPISYGTPLSGAQLNATASVPGTFAYTPAMGTVLAAGTQTLFVTFTPTDSSDYTPATTTAPITVGKGSPAVSWIAPAPISYGIPLSTTQLNATASVPGTFAYTPGIGTVLAAGTQTLSVTFTPTDSTEYATIASTVPMSVAKSSPVIGWFAPAPISYGTALTSTQLNATASVPGTFVYSPASGAVPAVGAQTLSVTFTPTDSIDYNATTTSVPLQVTQVLPTITWTPAPITYGTALSTTQLNATAFSNSTALTGTFSYTPAAGTMLSAGTQILSVSFVPTNKTAYASVSATVPLTVNQALPKITWAKPAAITYGTSLSSTQLNATASVPGTFAYAPAAGAVLNAGTQTLSVTFTPTDTTDYAAITSTMTITVSKVTPVVTWTVPAPAPFGTALSSTQLNATASVPGTFVYTPALGSVLTPGTQTLSVAFTPTDSTDYNAGKASAVLQITQATPIITWPAPAAITYGTALSATQLRATAASNGTAVTGTFTYTPATGTILKAGTQTLSVSLAPYYTIDYATATASVPITVNPATPKITWATPAAISYGTALSSTQLNATASVPGTFVYTPAAGTVMTAGTQTLSVTFNPNDSTDYMIQTTTTTVKINP